MLALAFIFFFAGGLGWLCYKIKLPPLLGYLFTGFIFGPSIPNTFNLSKNSFFESLFLDYEHLEFSSYIRSSALLIILLRTGLHLKWNDLKSIGRPALLMGVIPLALEVLAVYHFSMTLFQLSATEASLLSFCIAAVSPAVIVPSMLKLIRSGKGSGKKIPALVLAGASLDDVLALAGFSAMLALAQNSNGVDSLNNTLLAIGIGSISGAILAYLSKLLFSKVTLEFALTLMSISICGFMILVEQSQFIPFSSVIAIMIFGFFLNKLHPQTTRHIGHHLKQLWRVAECLLFVMVGAAVAPTYLIKAGWLGVALIALGLIARSLGVWVSLIKTPFNTREKLFCVLAYLPKATVQAAIGGIALQLVQQDLLSFQNGLPAGEKILALSVMSIAITAPIGALAISKSTHLITKS